MELWIRSQDRKMLRINPELEIFEYGKRKILIIDTKNCIDYNKLKILGTYETTERALKVLDEIQEIIDHLNDTNLNISKYVYQMPKE